MNINVTPGEVVTYKVDIKQDPPQGMIIFVTIGVPFSNIPIAQKVMLYVEPTTDTPVTAAKKLRKDIADHIEMHGWTPGTNFNPSELYFDIYYNVTDDVPAIVSANSRNFKPSIGRYYAFKAEENNGSTADCTEKGGQEASK